MAIRISGNQSASFLQSQLNKTNKNLNDSLNALSSGTRLTKASIDPAALAIANQLTAEINTSAVASRNVSDGVSLISIADGSLESADSITGRMSELANQASNGTLSDSQRQSLDNEFQALKSELNRISGSTSFNGENVFNQEKTLQVGTDGSEGSQISVSTPEVSSSGLGLETASLLTQGDAQAALDSTKEAGETISSSRAELGAVESRLNTAFQNLQTERLANQEARSAIADVDVAEKSSELASQKIRQQGTVSLMSISNNQSQNILKLLGA